MICNKRHTTRFFMMSDWGLCSENFHQISPSVINCSLDPRFCGEIHFDGCLMSCEQSREERPRPETLTGVQWPVPGEGSGQVYTRWTQWREECAVEIQHPEVMQVMQWDAEAEMWSQVIIQSSWYMARESLLTLLNLYLYLYFLSKDCFSCLIDWPLN